MFGHDFPYLDTRDINLDWLLTNMKTLVQEWTEYQLSMNQQFSNLSQAFQALHDFVTNYFDNLDVQEEINRKLSDMAESGELLTIIQPTIASETTDWLTDHITNPSSPPLDTSLTVAGAAADAKAAGQFDIEIRLANSALPGHMRATWVSKRVDGNGNLVNSPSQITNQEMLYIGAGNIIQIQNNDETRQVALYFYEFDPSENVYHYTGGQHIKPLHLGFYFNALTDYVRISFVGTSANPPLISEFTITFIEAVNKEFCGKRFAFCGDSITTYLNISESGFESAYYPEGTVDHFDKTYWHLFWSAAGGSDDYVVTAISQSAWRSQNNPNRPPLYDDARIARIGSNGNPDYIFINLGTNDPYSVNTGDEISYTYDYSTLLADGIYSVPAIQGTLRKIQNTYPDAKIICLIPKFASAISATEPYTLERFNKICDTIKESADLYGIYKVVDFRKCGITAENFSTYCINGTMHPNYKGMKLMGMYMMKELLICNPSLTI